MDDLDLRIFRWMYPGGMWSWWGTDPRITTTEIGSHVGLERAAVWARIRNWKREGFWNGFEVRSNPGIFRVGQVHVEVRVLGAARGADLIADIEQLDGVLWARVVSGTAARSGREGEVVLVTLVSDNAKGLSRRLRLLRRLTPMECLEGPFRNDTPPCSGRLTPLDWRIVAALSAEPNSSAARLASLLGITLKTFAHHHSKLIEGNAIFYLPSVDWSKLGCVVLGLNCRSAEDVDRVRSELLGRYPASIPMTLAGFEGIAPDWDHSTCFAAMVPSHSPHSVHALIRDISKIPGVKLARSETWGPERLYHEWTDRRIAAHVITKLTPSTGFALLPGIRDRSGLAGGTSAEKRTVTAQ